MMTTSSYGKSVLVFVSLVLLPALVAAQSPAAQADGRYMVEFRQVGPAAVSAIHAAGGTAVHQFPDLNVIAARLPAAALQALRANPNVLAIEEDPRRYPFAQVTPYGIAMVQANQVDYASAGNRMVCVIDSGFYAAHEDLQSTNVTAPPPDSGTGNPLTDKCGHGTHVAGTIAALHNDTGVVGIVGTGALKLHIVKVFGDNCSWTYSSNLIAAATACEDAGAHVISMSLGGSFKSRFEEQKFNTLYSAGRLSVAAAGNAGSTAHSYPASYGSVISVAAVDANKTVASFSQRNNQVELAAPGVGVLSTVPWIGASVTASGVKYLGSGIEGAATTTGVSGGMVNGGLCGATSAAWAGAVVLCERGSVSFYDKVRNVQNSGGKAAVIYNNVSGGFAGTLGTGNTSTIPAIGISREDGQVLAGWTGPATVVSSTDPGSGYEAWDGTSMATPHVSGVAALVWSHNPGWTNAMIREALQNTAEDLGTAGRDNSYGYGLVRAKAALDYLTGGNVGDGNGGGGNGGDGGETQFTLAASGSKIKGERSAELSWTGSAAPSIDVYRDGAKVNTVANSGNYTESLGKGGGSFTYQVCETGTSVCSNAVTVSF